MKVKKEWVGIQTILIGTGIGIAVIVLLSMLLGMLIVRGVIPERFIEAGGTAAAMIGAATAVLYSSGGTKKLMTALITGALLLLLMLLIHGVAFRETGYVWPPSVISVLATALLLGIVRSLKPKRRRY